MARANELPRPLGRLSFAPVSPLAQYDSVWLHGAGLAGDTWHGITAGYRRATTPDLPGHGTAPMIAPPSVEAFAETLVPALPQDVLLVGHSLGGMVALELAARAPTRIAGLVLIEAVPTIRDRLSSCIAAAFAARIYKTIPPAWSARIFGLGQGAATRAELNRQLARKGRHQIGAALDAAARYDGRPRLSQIKAPTLVIVGRDSTATHYGAGMIADGIEGAQFLRLPGGHMLHTDNPLQLRRAIEGFMRRAGDARA
ncbi:MAG: alpha/beta hydrolase [Pseudomonadota bacterium]